MSEKRYWLIRSSDYWLVDRDKVKRIGSASWQTTDGARWSDRATACPVAPDGTVYGHHLEPGGGPVDVSEWFPEGGRECGNCGWHTHFDDEGNPCNREKCVALDIGDNPEWKPRKQEPLYATGTCTIQGIEKHYPPGTGPGEEGGRTMKKFPVEVWKWNEKGERVKLLAKAPTFMEATSAQNARDKVVLAIAKIGAGVDDHEIVICKPLPLAE